MAPDIADEEEDVRRSEDSRIDTWQRWRGSLKLSPQGVAVLSAYNILALSSICRSLRVLFVLGVSGDPVYLAGICHEANEWTRPATWKIRDVLQCGLVGHLDEGGQGVYIA